MASNKRLLKSYVRYDGTGRIISGSNILSRLKPKVGGYVETPAYVCCNPGEGCANSSYLDNQTYNDNPNPYSTPNNMVTNQTVSDSDCNMYKFGVIRHDDGPAFEYPFGSASYEPIYLEKFNSSGELVWQRLMYWTFQGYGFGYPESIQLGVDGDLYIVGTYGFAKINHKTGATMWQKVYNSEVEHITTLHPSNGRVYLVSQQRDFGEDTFYLMDVREINPSTGDTISAVKIGFDSLDNNSSYAGFTHTWDSNNNLIITYNNCCSPNYVDVIMKLDANLNVLWSKQILPDEEGFNDLEITGISTDLANNIALTFGWGWSVLKLDENGDPVWSKYLNLVDYGIFYRPWDCVFDKNGNVFVNGSVSDPAMISALNYPSFTAKITSAGTLDFVYTTDSVTLVPNWWFTDWYSTYMRIYNDTLYVSGSADTAIYPVRYAQVWKMPLSVVTGTYGDWTYIDQASSYLQDGALTTSDIAVLSQTGNIWTPFPIEFVNVELAIPTYTTIITS